MKRPLSPIARRILVPIVAWVLATALPSAAGDGSAELLGAALTRSKAHDKLTYLSDHIGHRLSGSAALDRAIEWAGAQMERDGLEKVWTESVMVPRWVRGDEAARILNPVDRPIPLLALGGSVGTPEGGIEAEVVVVDGFEQLEAAGDSVRGRIVLFNLAMAGFGEEPGYGTVVKLRSGGSAAAARLGAVGMLIRSLGTANFRLPHTGALRYADDAPKIPSAAISAEDAELIHRLTADGVAVRFRLELGAKTHDDVESANVLAEIRGSDLPDEIVLIGAHLDSWDVGHGAHDDGSGCVVVMETMRLIAELDQRPRRTIRAVLFTNEENGLRGGKDYAERHGSERHVAAIESDAGGDAPVGFGVSAGPGGVEMIEAIAAGLAGIDASKVFPRGGGADISPLRKLGVPVMGLVQDTRRYFHYHHTTADTLDKVDRVALDRNVAAMAHMAYALANHPETLPALEPEVPAD